MHQVQVEVVGTELLQGVLDSELDVLWVVVDLEELGGDEELRSVDARVLDTLTDLIFVLVTPSTAGNTTVSGDLADSHFAEITGGPGVSVEASDSLDVPVTSLNQSATELRRISLSDLLTRIAASTAVATSPGLGEQISTIQTSVPDGQTLRNSRGLPL